jgi:peptidoglycan/LPS O-acetylase OafA/YrhL
MSASGPGSEIRSLTSIRFFAAMAVVIYHFEIYAGVSTADFTYLFANGSLAVDFFFVLSGFILWYSYRSQIESGRFLYSDFVVKRFARLYPLHLVTTLGFLALLALFLVAGLDPNDWRRYDPAVLPLHFTMTHAWFDTGADTEVLPWNGPSWSISAEWFAYVAVFPVLAVALRRIRRGVVALWLGVAFFAAFVAVHDLVFDRDLFKRTIDAAILRILPEFALGAALCRFSSDWRIPRAAARPLYYAALAGALGMLHAVDPHAGLPHAVTVLCFGALIVALHQLALLNRSGALDAAVLRYGGEISYSIYMTHALVGAVWFNGARLAAPGFAADRPVVALAVGVVLVVAASAVLYHVVEVPARRRIYAAWRRLGRRDTVA